MDASRTARCSNNCGRATSPAIAERERRAGQIVEAVGPLLAGRIARQHFVARDLVAVAQVQTQIYAREQIAPLHTGSVVVAVSRRRQIEARRAQKYGHRQRIAEAIAIVERTHAEQQVAIDVVELDAHTQVAAFAHGAPRADGEMRSDPEAFSLRRTAVEADRQFREVDAGIREQLRAAWTVSALGPTVPKAACPIVAEAH